MKQKKFMMLAASMMVAVAGLVSCGVNEDNPIEPIPDDDPIVEPELEFEADEAATYSMNFSKAEEYPYWRMDAPEGSSYDVVNKKLLITNEKEQANNWDLQPFIIDGLNLKAGYDYKVRITMAASADGNAVLALGTWNGTMYQNFGVTAGDEYTQYEVLFPASTVETANNDAHILMQVGKFVGTIKIKLVEVFEIAPVIPEPDPIKAIDFSAPKDASGADVQGYPYYKMGAPEGSSYDVVDGELVIENTIEQANYYDLQPFIIDWFNVQEGFGYKVRITMKASANGNVNLRLGTWSAGVDLPLEITAGDEYQQYEVVCESAPFASSNNDVHVLFQSGKYIGKVNIKKVEVFEIAPEGPLPEKTWEEIFKSDGTDVQNFSVKYFKNYLAAQSVDGAIVVESLDPDKVYDQYYNGGSEAKVANNHDVQFLISLPQTLAANTKVKVSMKIKAEKEAQAETQAHSAIPAPGAIEGVDGYAGTYIHYALMGSNIPFTTAWDTFEKEFTVPSEADGMQSICLNLEVLRELNKYYFDEIVVSIEK